MDRLSRQPDKPGSVALAAIDDSAVVTAYARWAPIYDRIFGIYTRGPCRVGVAEVNALPAGRVLEVGVGTGIALPLYDPKHQVTGVDLSPDMLAIARKRMLDKKLTNIAAIEQMDASHLLFGDASFDVTVAMFVITTVPDPDRVLSEMIRTTKPGGRVILLNHFSVESGPRAAVERLLAPLSAKLGFRPNFPIGQVLGRPELKLVKRQNFKTFDLFTMLVFERLAG